MILDWYVDIDTSCNRLANNYACRCWSSLIDIVQCIIVGDYSLTPNLCMYACMQADLLEEYERDRKRTNMAMMAILDGLQKMYATDLGPLDIARSAGFTAVHLLGPIKKKMISYAMGDL